MIAGLLSLLLACSDKAPPDGDTAQDDSAEDTAPLDSDGDGFDADADCDDADAAVHPGADEVCDGLDNDCDGVIDTDAVDQGAWYADADADGWGVEPATLACDPPSGMADQAGDCDDGDAAVSPGAEEICDERDNDCDSDVDEDLATGSWWPDNDSDGYGDEASAAWDTCLSPSGYAENGDDCDDSDPEQALSCANDPVRTLADCDGSISRWSGEELYNPELHIFGVYEGDGGHGSPAGDTLVSIDRPTVMTLVLTSYEPVNWIVTVSDETTLLEVILNGYDEQTIEAPEGVTVTNWSPHPANVVSSAYDWGDPEVAKLADEAEKHSGATLSSFTGCYHGTSYTLE